MRRGGWRWGAVGLALALSGPAAAGDAVRGEAVFWMAGCASCHADAAAEGDARLIQSGGRRFETEFGTFIAPNISSDPTHGLGAWSEAAFVRAMTEGVSPDGANYYPAFPYTSYTRMSDADLSDLWAFMKTLPASDRASEPHEIGFPFSMRFTLTFWKWLYLDDAPVITVDAGLERGRYLVEGPGHCAECHTPRSVLGGLDTARWMGGAPNPDGKGRIPNITPGAGEFSGWSVEDIAYYLETGFTPDYDSVGGSMAAVVSNTARLTSEDRMAIARYLKALPAVQPE